MLNTSVGAGLMNRSPTEILRSLAPALFFCLLLPLPAIVLWHCHDGRFIALCCFFVGSTNVVVWSFQKDVAGQAPAAVWGSRIVLLGLALMVEWAVFAGCLVVNDPHDLVAPVLALLALIPALCIAPYLTLRTRKRVAAIVFTLFLTGSMKFVAGSVNCLVYGWHADTTMIWTPPNLIASAFLVSAAILSASFYLLGARKYRCLYDRASEPGAAPNGDPTIPPEKSKP